jgi:hypothetical protein
MVHTEYHWPLPIYVPKEYHKFNTGNLFRLFEIYLKTNQILFKADDEISVKEKKQTFLQLENGNY